MNGFGSQHTGAAALTAYPGMHDPGRGMPATADSAIATWAFPAPSPEHGFPASQSWTPATGGGKPAPGRGRSIRFRWGRMGVVVTLIALLGFSVSNMAMHGFGRSAGNPATRDATSIANSDSWAPGGGDAGAGEQAPASTPPTRHALPAQATTHSTGRAATAHGTRAANTRGHSAPNRHRRSASGGGSGAVLGLRVGSQVAQARTHTATRTGRVAAATGLPRTGAPSWLAVVLGMTLLLVGISMHVNAMKIGATALLYRRGPLLRPSYLVGCARTCTPIIVEESRAILADLAGQVATRLGGLARVLHAPRAASDFVRSGRG